MENDLISRSALMEKSYCSSPATMDNPWGGDSVVNVEDIENAPAVDAVEVVRCKDCQYYDASEWMDEGEKVCKCWVDWLPTSEDDFCSNGVRRTDDGGS